MSQAASVSVSLPLFRLVIGAQLVFLTSPQVTREGRFSDECPKGRSSMCQKENMEEIGRGRHWRLGEAGSNVEKARNVAFRKEARGASPPTLWAGACGPHGAFRD